MTDWSLERKLEHSEAMALKLLDRYPQLAEIWLKSADIIREQISKENSK